jgi:hypothetical protein
MKWVFFALVLAIVFGTLVLLMRRKRPSPPLPALTSAQQILRGALERDVRALAAIGERHAYAPENLQAAANYVAQSFAPLTVERQAFRADGVLVENLIVEIAGSSHAKEIVVIGAHYDTVDGTPGADDNASGVAALLALAKRFAAAKPSRTLRFVAFTNEEPPFFKSQEMGSWQYANRCHERGETIVAMLSLEMLGYYDTRPGSQQYPAPLAALFPDTADFIAFAGNLASRDLVQRCARVFEEAHVTPVQSAALPDMIEYAGWSDQWSFWQFGWQGFMVTDTALFRNPHYHGGSDTPETLDYERMARTVDGLAAVIEALVRA